MRLAKFVVDWVDMIVAGIMLIMALALLLAGCSAAVVEVPVTVTPQSTMTTEKTPDKVTSTAEPTITPEPTSSIPDGNVYYYPLNDNYEMLVGQVTRLYPDADGIFRRIQCIPSGMDFRWEPRPLGPQTPPWVECDADHRFNGLHIAHISDIDGEFYWRVPAIRLNPGACYILKISLENETVIKPGETDGHLYGVAWLYALGDPTVAYKLPEQPFPRMRNFEMFWPIRTDQAIAVIEFEVGFAVNFPAYLGNIEVDAVAIEQTRTVDGFCDSPLTTEW